MGKKFFINCDEATTICDKSQYGEASLYDKIRLNIHMIMCKHCRKYTKQNSLMTQLFGKFATPCDDSEHMPDKDKKELQHQIEKELDKS